MLGQLHLLQQKQLGIANKKLCRLIKDIHSEYAYSYSIIISSLCDLKNGIVAS